MSDKLILDFPVLQQGGGDFVEAVSYEVEASKANRELTIKHVLKGASFIRQFIEAGVAKFAVSLLYRDSSERQHHLCRTEDINTNNDEITCSQTIPMDFSYAPEITPNIVILEDRKTTVDDSSGLTDFWDKGDSLDIPKYARIALDPKLKFTSGDVSNLMKIVFDENLNSGEVKVVVNENAGEGETPVSVLCGQDVYDELHKVTQSDPSNAVESMRSAIITQVLCAVYAYMQNLKSEQEIGGVLSAHLEELESETRENWNNENFNPSLAATKMRPYAIQALHKETDDA